MRRRKRRLSSDPHSKRSDRQRINSRKMHVHDRSRTRASGTIELELRSEGHWAGGAATAFAGTASSACEAREPVELRAHTSPDSSNVGGGAAPSAPHPEDADATPHERRRPWPRSDVRRRGTFKPLEERPNESQAQSWLGDDPWILGTPGRLAGNRIEVEHSASGDPFSRGWIENSSGIGLWTQTVP
jgi:hypothetical protein